MNVECLDKEPAFADRMMQVCKLIGVEPPVPFHVADLTKRLPLEDHTFDAVLCISVLEHLPSDRRLFAAYELWRLVAPGGRMIMTMDVSLTGGEEGLLLSKIEAFRLELEKVVGALPVLPMPLPKDTLTPQHPGYGLAPIRVGKQVVRFGPRSWLLRLRNTPLPLFKPIAYLLFSIPNTIPDK